MVGNTRNQISSKLSKLKGKNSISVITINKKIKKILEQGFEPWTFRATIECSNSWATRGPNCYATTDIKALQLMNGAISRWCNDRKERQYDTLWCFIFDVLWSAFIRYTIYSYKIDADILKPSTNVQKRHTRLSNRHMFIHS